jgi:type II secretory pathway component PulF
MPKFKYLVRDANGKASSGVLEANDHDELRRMLRVNNLFLTRYKEAGRSGGDTTQQSSSSLFSVVKGRDIVILVRQMATLVRAGVPFNEGILSLEAQSDKPQIKQMLKEMHQGVMEGRALSDTMRGYPKIFNQLTVSLVEAGENTGTLDHSLFSAAEQLDREEDLRSRVKAAMVYPKIVVAAAFGTVALMMLLVIPTFKMVYVSFHGELPMATQALITISDFTVKFWWLLAALFGAAWYGFMSWKKTPRGSRIVDTYVLKIYIVGPLLRKVSIARVAQTLAIGLKGGVSVLRSLVLAASTAGNVVIRDAVMGTVNQVRDGSQMAEELEKTKQFPPMVIQMMKSGEMTGNLDHMLEEVNRYYEEDIKYAIDKMTKMIEPIMTVVVGSIVLFVLLALYMPVFNLGKTVLGNK